MSLETTGHGFCFICLKAYKDGHENVHAAGHTPISFVPRDSFEAMEWIAKEARRRTLVEIEGIVREMANDWKEPEWNFERHEALMTWMTGYIKKLLSRLQELHK